MKYDYKDLLENASNIVREVASTKLLHSQSKKITVKKDASFVTNFDLDIDRELRTKLKHAFPDIEFISEEIQKDTDITKNLCWCIDPIDGTHNFIFNIPYYAISVGLLLNGKPIAGIIYDPISNDILTGMKELGVFINGKPFSVENTSCIITTNRSHKKEDKDQENIYINKILEKKNLKYRRFASCALDLMNIVQGRIGATYVIGNSIWDWAAGYAIAETAGYIICHKDKSYFYVTSTYLKNEIIC